MTYDEMQPGLSCSYFGIPTPEDLINCRNHGFTMIEVCVVERWMEMDAPELAAEWIALAEKAAALGVTVWSVHLPYVAPFDISRLEPGMAKQAIQLHSSLIETAAETLCPRKYILHASHEPIDDSLREQRLLLAKESLVTLAGTATSLGAQLCVECLPRSCIGRDIDEINRLIEDHPELGVCCDTNHLLTGRAEDFILAFPNRIASVHLSDYDGIDERHWLPGKGINNWSAILDALHYSGYSGPLMLEVRALGLGEPVTLDDLAASVRKLRTGA